MNTTKLKLTNPTDDELNAAVATHVCGYAGVDGGMMRLPDTRMRGNVFESWKRVPPYATSADAVLPLLDSPKYIAWWEARLKLNGTHQVRCHQSEVDSFLAESATFPRAACIALLRANGIEVEIAVGPPPIDAKDDAETIALRLTGAWTCTERAKPNPHPAQPTCASS